MPFEIETAVGSLRFYAAVQPMVSALHKKSVRPSSRKAEFVTKIRVRSEAQIDFVGLILYWFESGETVRAFKVPGCVGRASSQQIYSLYKVRLQCLLNQRSKMVSVRS